MKKLVTITLAVCMALGAGNVYGQQVETQKKEKVQKEVKMQKAEGEKEMEKKMEKAQEGEKEMEKQRDEAQAGERKMEKQRDKAMEGQADPQGNAYGRNNGGLEGKEFGQARATDAKAARRAKAKRERIHKRAVVKRGR